MTEAGFFAQKTNSPKSLALVIALHGGLIAAVMMIKSPVFTEPFGPTLVRLIPIEPEPPVEPPPPQQYQTQQPRSHIDPVPQVVPTDTNTGVVIASNDHTNVISEVIGTGDRVLPPPPPPPFRRAADWDPRYASALQPPYPATEERAQRDGVVRVRVTIGPDGRVTAVERLSATSDAFWRVTEQQALRRWRFRPATLDGRPVEDSKVVTLNFRIADL